MLSVVVIGSLEVSDCRTVVAASMDNAGGRLRDGRLLWVLIGERFAERRGACRPGALCLCPSVRCSMALDCHSIARSSRTDSVI